MKGDFTRFTFDRARHFTGVRLQQGRVQIDADWNEQVDLTHYRTVTEARDVIGPCGAPKHHAGFAIAPSAGGDFTIGAGRYYAGGWLCENDDAVAFTVQPDLPGTTPIAAPGRYLVYLDVWTRHLTALEVPGIRETALGGPDTATRTRTVWQVKLLPVGPLGSAVTCVSEPAVWTELVTSPTGRLRARSMPGDPDDKPCIVPPGAGYRRLENQLYRVEIHRGGNTAAVNPNDRPTFKWSRENGSIAAKVQTINATSVDLAGAPRDPTTGLAPGQWIELTDDLHDLLGLPGTLVEITAMDDLRLTVDVPNAIGTWSAADFALNPRIRRWDSVRVLDVTTPLVNDGYLALEDGVEVRFESGTYRTGDYWTVPARTNTADVEWPLDTSVSPAVPRALAREGILHEFCRLAVIEFDGTTVSVIEDCRPLFPPLTELEDGCNCCTVTVSPGGGADFSSIQAAVNSLPSTGGKVCVLAGEYSENILILGRRNITIVGCGLRSRVTAAADAPVIHIANSESIHIESLALVAEETAPGILAQRTGGLAVDVAAAAFRLRDLSFRDLAIVARRRSAIEVHDAEVLAIRECQLFLEDLASPWPGIFLVAEDALVERNELRGRLFSRGNDQRIPGSSRSGGIQIGGLSERVRIINNLIVGGSGQGITLGSLRVVTQDGGDGGFPTDPHPEPEDPCDPCRPGDPIVVTRFPGGDGVEFRVISAGTLSEIRIERNRILTMGLDGIGVAGFFDLRAADEFISVDGLEILGNDIRECLWRRLATLTSSLTDMAGYGGIALADVENLVVRDNTITDNGIAQAEPVCGVFVLHGVGVDLDRNRIVNNGNRVTPLDREVDRGRRGGIHIVYALAPVLASVPANTSVTNIRVVVPEPTGIPAARIHDNVVSAPLGRALTLGALGPVSVVGNQFTSSGVPATTRANLLEPATVMILNLGLSNELFLQVLAFILVQNGGLKPKPGLDDFTPGRFLANGNVLFTNNQCSLDLLEPGTRGAFSSIAILTLDDLAFEDNQCDCNLGVGEDFLLTQALLLGLSLRATDNRFKEGLLNAPFSGITWGWMNTTAHNQTTHCLLIQGDPGLTVNAPNTILISRIREGFCGESLRATLANFVQLLASTQ
ncbi:MAG: hypothetical protein IT581_02415 [Verrucomicrobiales bacterium]|nr:hypothetical protein [Verrucomicrobiales bacterium]